MKILFRVDSGWHIGNGHLMRCIELAEAFLAQGFESVFVSKNHDKNSINLIPKKFKTYTIFDGAVSYTLDKLAEKVWIGESLGEEISLINDIVRKLHVDTVIFDHYSIDYEYEQKINCNFKIVIDDRMNRRHEANILVDYNISAEEEKYKQLVSDKCKLLLGDRYTLISKKFSEASNKYKQGSVLENILITFGASDINNDSESLINAYLKTDHNYQLTVLLSENHDSFKSLKEINDARIRVCTLVSHMEEFLLDFDLCIGACGTSALERFSFGLPSVLVTTAENQKLVMTKLVEKEFVNYLGDTASFTIENWIEIFNGLDTRYQKLVDDSNLAKRYFDGNGIDRLVESIRNIYEHSN